MYGGYDSEIGSGGDYDSTFAAFGEKSVRLGFIRKVYSILSVQLIISFGFVLIPVASEPVAQFARSNPWLLILSMVFAFGAMITLACCNVHRQYPVNFICLGIFTLAQSFMLMAVGATTKPDVVLWAVIITAVVVVALTAFAFQSKIDFTTLNGVMFVLLIVLLLMGIIMSIVGAGRIMQIIYAGLGAFIFSVYIVIDTQMIVGGSHKYQFSPEDYVFGAITLYVDIINLFLMILQLLNASRD